MIVKRREDYRAYRISPGDSNRMVLLVNPLAEAASFVSIVEIFDVGGRTPPNRHEVGQEMFYVLSGEGLAHAGGRTVPVRAGDCIVLLPGTEHEVENTGSTRLYCLTTMVPNDGFAELILGGEEVGIDDADWQVIAGGPVDAAPAP